MPITTNPLTVPIAIKGGYFATIDEADADLAKSKWSVLRRKGSEVVYARNRTGLMHRQIMARILGRNLEGHEHVDHADRNTLNNTRANLRLCTPSQNGANRSLQRNNTSGYKGVSFHKHSQKWKAAVRVNGYLQCLGYFHTPEEAFEAYSQAAANYFGEFARPEKATSSEHN